MRIITAREQVQLLAAWDDASKRRSDGRRMFKEYSQEPSGHVSNQDWDEYGSPLHGDLPEYIRHFPHGESHVRYVVHPKRDDGTNARGDKVYKDRGGVPPESWWVTHQGVWQGHLIPDKPEGGQYDFKWPTYKREKDGSPENVRNGGTAGTWTYFLGNDFQTHEEAQAAAEAHFDKHYRSRPKPDADYYDNILNDLPDLDEGYGDFGGMFGDKT
jgi:hypothetical protein